MKKEQIAKNKLPFQFSFFIILFSLFFACKNTLVEPFYGRLIKQDGTARYPYLIYTEEDLRKVGTSTDGWDLDKHYKLMNTITLPTPLPGSSNWTTPIGGIPTDFTGTFNGNNKTINNLIINTSGAMHIGLFGIIGIDGIVKNLRLVNCDITEPSVSNVGGVAGRNDGIIDNCFVSGDIFGEETVGGIVGYNSPGAIVRNSHTTADVSGALTGGFRVGGVVGDNNGTVNNSNAAGDISGIYIIGGVVGENNGTVQNSYYTTGTVSGNIEIGGIVGTNVGSTVNNCYVTGEVRGRTEVGGIAGINSGGSSRIENCYSAGNVIGLTTSDNIGGIVGYIQSGMVQNCVALNPSISIVTGLSIGRVYGLMLSGSADNNYAKSDMNVNGFPVTSGIGPTTKEGENVYGGTINGQYNNLNFWNTSSPPGVGWDFSAIWQWSSSKQLPILRNVRGQ